MRTFIKRCARCRLIYKAQGPDTRICDPCLTPDERAMRQRVRDLRAGLIAPRDRRRNDLPHQAFAAHPPLVIRGTHVCANCGRGVTITVTHDELARDVGHRPMGVAV